MAALESPHLEAVPTGVRELLPVIAALPFSPRFYLGGGTALALSLNDFRNADHDVPVDALMPVTWEEIKGFFLSEARRLAKLWFISPEQDDPKVP